MTRILRLLLIAAIALPYCGNAAAQDATNYGNSKPEFYKKTKPITFNGQTFDMNITCEKEKTHQPHVTAKAPSLKAGGKQIYDHFTQLVYYSSSTQENVPIRGSALNTDRAEGQMIYQASQLNIQNGDLIYAITFYTNDTIPITGSENSDVTLRIGEVPTNTTGINNYTTMTNNRSNYATHVAYSGYLPVVKGKTFITFTFDEPYTYTGKNLIVDLVTNGGSYSATISWHYGSAQSQASYYSYRPSNGGQPSSGSYNRLPSTEFSYKRPHQGAAPSSRNITVLTPNEIAAKSYTWPITGDSANTKVSYLNEIATNPEQMIAMIQYVYKEPSIPGNKKRGFASDGSNTGETNQACFYPGVGGIKYTGSSYNASSLTNKNNYEYEDIYGWGLTGDINNIGTSEYLSSRTTGGFISTTTRTYAYYTTFNQQQYAPTDEGLTLLLVEMKEGYKDGSNDSISTAMANATGYDRLKAFFQNTVKSVRVISEAKRTGEGFESGTLFKIDCDHMNKFFLLAKGQLHLDHNSDHITRALYTNGSLTGTPETDNFDFSIPPSFIHYWTENTWGNTTNIGNIFFDYGGELFYDMFEQFSPTMPSAFEGADDLYQNMINMESFPVIHDCLGITGMNHQFLMYGADSKDEDCQDVRDMMFFIPDYRMLYHDNRGSSSQEYLNYHPDLQPTVGMYVIRQDEITPTAEEDEYYMLQLNWRTNLDDFLPSEQQEFHLLQVVVDETTGQETYVPVYYMNANGEYTDADGNVVGEANKVAIVLHLGPGEEKSYPDVYVKRLSHGQQVTYAIQGRDYDPVTQKSFLSLQISNRQSYIVPGTDPTELVMLNNATYYSRYNPQTEMNCYSNKISVGNYIGGLTENLIQGGTADPTIFKFYRMLSEEDTNPVLIGTAKVSKSTSGNGGTLTITMNEVEGVQSPATEFPYGSQTGLSKRAGYHANKTTAEFTYYKNADNSYITDANGKKYVNFGNDFYVYDNFVEDLHKTDLPNRYYYKIEFNTAENIKDKDGNSVGNTAHGNVFNIPVYRTASAIDGSFTFDDVKGDEGGNLTLPEAINFDVNFEYGSKTELYRYDAYRWMNTPANQRFILSEVDGDDEQDIAPTGTASYQGDNFTVKMNNEYVNDPDNEYYEAHVVNVATTGYTKGSFIDNIPIKKTDNPAAVYDYAPVIERYASGFDANRTDYNTYGGIIQTVATGKLEMEDATDAQFMSIYNWENEDKTKKYAYYTIKMSLDKSIPETQGYSLYKIRAWRVLDPSIEQAEELPEMQGRMGAKVMFEDVTYDPSKPYIVDALDVVGAAKNSPEGSPIPYYTGTFGAQKLRTTEPEGDNSVIDEIKGKIIVRMYFTRNANLPTASGAPRLLDETTADGKFYIVEKEIEFSKTGGGTITGIDNLEAREVAGVKYYNVAGIESNQPFKGVNIVVTRYTDGSVVTKKVIR